jgi:hypothetical protein
MGNAHPQIKKTRLSRQSPGNSNNAVPHSMDINSLREKSVEKIPPQGICINRKNHSQKADRRRGSTAPCSMFEKLFSLKKFQINKFTYLCNT